MQNPLKSLPSVNELLESPPLRRLVSRVNRNVVVAGARSFLDNLRGQVQSATAEMHVPSPVELAERIAEWILSEEQSPLRPVINATGVLLDDALGNAPLAAEALRAVGGIAGSYSSVELDLDTGQSADRLRAVEKMLREHTGAEAVAVVGTAVASKLITLAALAGGREVVVARAHLFDEGGLRLTDLVASAGARLREVGAANRFDASDYNAAVSRETAALLHLHPSGFSVSGNTRQPTLAEVAAVARKRSVPLVADLGMGGLIDVGRFGLREMPTAADSIKAGADLVTMAGDKLLGGPPCGIILGKKSLVQQIAAHPRMHAVKADKLTLAALAATLTLYREPDKSELAVPLLALLAASSENLKHRAEHMAPQLAAAKAIASAEALEAVTHLGPSAISSHQLPTWRIAIRPAHGRAESLARRLRTGNPAIVPGVEGDRLVLDLRSVFPSQDMQIVEAIETLDRAEAESPNGAPDSDPLPDAE
jgi:L-seryl-tRNA(Ser) seleniumtransferase